MRGKTRNLLLIGSVMGVFVCACLLGACGESAQSAHTEHSYDGVWIVETEATCEEDGLRYQTCVYPGCGERKTEPIPALGHDPDAGTITVRATCTEGGVRTRTCNRCHKTITEPTDPIGHDWIPDGESTATCTEPGTQEQICSVCHETRSVDAEPLGHDWRDGEIVPATCTENGKVIRICNRCSEEDTEVIPKYNHLWKRTKVITEATCDAGGVEEWVCQRTGCMEREEVQTEKLGHRWQNFYTVDRQPSFEEAGEKSYHCTRCDAKNGTTEIPKLDANTPIEYEFRTLRNNGEYLFDSAITITVFDETGAEVAKSNGSTLSNGIFRASLLPKSYTVRVTNLPEGYSAETSYEVTPFDPYCNLWLSASPLQGNPAAGTLYKVGSVMHDFTIPASATTTGEAYTLSDLLKTKKMVLLNFWATYCGPCQAEFPLLEQVYGLYKDEFAVLAIDTDPSETLSDIREYAAENRLTFPMMRELDLGLSNLFSAVSQGSIPFTVIVDREGVICTIKVGTTSSFEELVRPYLSDGYWQHGGNVAESARALEALPAKKED